MNEHILTTNVFDETTYLELNPDVSEAVLNGLISSGWEHYILYGCLEDRLGISPEVNKAMKELAEYRPSVPYPPKHLRERVHGDENLIGFERIGQIIAGNIHTATHTVLEFHKRSRILDFGCGCGRVLRYLKRFSNLASFYGTDIDEEAISWCQENLSELGNFQKNGDLPPLQFEEGFFDFIYSISVFTHLPENMQFAWLEELQRVTKPGGFLLLTTHGVDLLINASEDDKKAFQEKGFLYFIGSATEGLPEYYQTSYHSEDYILNQWSSFFEIKKIIKKGIANHQNLVLCRKPG